MHWWVISHHHGSGLPTLAENQIFKWRSLVAISEDNKLVLMLWADFILFSLIRESASSHHHHQENCLLPLSSPLKRERERQRETWRGGPESCLKKKKTPSPLPLPSSLCLTVQESHKPNFLASHSTPTRRSRKKRSQARSQLIGQFRIGQSIGGKKSTRKLK